MAHQVRWNKIILDEFIRIGSLTDTEKEIMVTRVAGMTRVEQSIKLGLSLSTVDRAIKRCKQKYDNCCRFSPVLPPRENMTVFH